MLKEFFSLKNTLFLLLTIILVACSDDDNSDSGPIQNEDVEDSHLFVWNAMNSWYYYQPSVDNLDDSFNDNTTFFYEYLNDFSSPDNLFESLVVDPFSIITDDYEELGGGLSAFYEDFGFEYGRFGISGSDVVVGYVRYTFPGSPADDAGLERGDLFLEVDGQQLTQTNFFDIMVFNEGSFDLTMAEIIEDENGGLVVQQTGEVQSIGNENFQKVPVWLTETYDFGTNKIGYLFYSNFAFNFHEQLNSAFQELQSEGITDLVLDLRYNPGGSVLTAQYLASLIYSDDPNLLMGSIEYNSKHTNSNRNLFFQNEIEILNDDFESEGSEPISTLGLNRLVVITSTGTASASEFIINTLEPYMDVIIVGDQTVGKNTGSIPLYDNPSSDYLEKEGANPSHTYGMQLIVSKVFNSNGQSDYDNGFEPDISINELQFIQDLQPLGDLNEQLLATAIDQLCSTCRTMPLEFEEIDIGQYDIIDKYSRDHVLDVRGLQ